jgi:hypothetical protein
MLVLSFHVKQASAACLAATSIDEIINKHALAQMKRDLPKTEVRPLNDNYLYATPWQQTAHMLPPTYWLRKHLLCPAVQQVATATHCIKKHYCPSFARP